MKEDRTNEVLVDVCMLTYNHERYIQQAMESVLNQECKYNFRLNVFNDASQDKTGRVIREVTKSHPHGDRVRLFEHTKNIGMNSNGIFALNKCNAKYIAICEGDDYWCNLNKLQKQIEFLEKNPEFTIAFHRVNELTEDGSITEEQTNTSTEEEVYALEDLAAKNFMHTPSIVYRKNAIENIPSWYNESPVGDYVLNIIASTKGKIKYFPQVMSTYRQHSSSNWSSISHIERLERWLKVLELLIDELKTFPDARNIMISQFKKYYLHLKEDYLNSSTVDNYVSLMDCYSSKNFFHATWLEIYKQEMELLRTLPSGTRESFRFFIDELKKKWRN